MEVDDILNNFDREIDRTSQTKEDIYTRLSRAMLNERMAPEILPYENELLTEVLSKISDQQQFLVESHEYGDVNMESGIITSDFKLQLMIVETDIERLNYLVRLYFRVRLSKLENFTIHYIKLDTQDNKKTLLSLQERLYLRKYLSLLQNLYNKSILGKIPRDLSLLDDGSMVSEPDIDELVFIKNISDNTIQLTVDDDDEELIIETNDVFVVKFSLIRKYLEIGDVILI